MSDEIDLALTVARFGGFEAHTHFCSCEHLIEVLTPNSIGPRGRGQLKQAAAGRDLEGMLAMFKRKLREGGPQLYTYQEAAKCGIAPEAPKRGPCRR